MLTPLEHQLINGLENNPAAVCSAIAAMFSAQVAASVRKIQHDKRVDDARPELHITDWSFVRGDDEGIVTAKIIHNVGRGPAFRIAMGLDRDKGDLRKKPDAIIGAKRISILPQGKEAECDVEIKFPWIDAHLVDQSSRAFDLTLNTFYVDQYDNLYTMSLHMIAGQKDVFVLRAEDVADGLSIYERTVKLIPASKAYWQSQFSRTWYKTIRLSLLRRRLHRLHSDPKKIK